MRRNLPVSVYCATHADFAVLSGIEKEILGSIGGEHKLAREIGKMVRNAIDVVIDTPSTARCYFNDLEKTEKTYLGTRIEIHLRSLLGFPKGQELDLLIGGTEVDVKFTVGNNWMIPTEAVNRPCILVAADEAKELCYFGLIVARSSYLTKGDGNKDKKRSLTSTGFSNIRWLLPGQSYPRNFWRTVDRKVREEIFSIRGSGAKRVAKLFELVQSVPINRSVIEDVAQQVDAAKRARANGGARDVLARRGILLLSGKYDSKIIEERRLPSCGKDDFISTLIAR